MLVSEVTRVRSRQRTLGALALAFGIGAVMALGLTWRRDAATPSTVPMVTVAPAKVAAAPVAPAPLIFVGFVQFHVSQDVLADLRDRLVRAHHASREVPEAFAADLRSLGSLNRAGPVGPLLRRLSSNVRRRRGWAAAGLRRLPIARRLHCFDA
jgi:hypothetical protein